MHWNWHHTTQLNYIGLALYDPYSIVGGLSNQWELVQCI